MLTQNTAKIHRIIITSKLLGSFFIPKEKTPLEAFYFTFTSITFFAASALEPPTKI